MVVPLSGAVLGMNRTVMIRITTIYPITGTTIPLPLLQRNHNHSSHDHSAFASTSPPPPPPIFSQSSQQSTPHIASHCIAVCRSGRTDYDCVRVCGCECLC